MPATPDPTSSVLALDVGDARVGVAATSLVACLPRPLTTLQRGDDFYDELQQIIKTENITTIVVGLPRGLAGQRTAQTTTVENFVTELHQHIDLPIAMQDEALTSQKALAELETSGKPYQKADIDALAATYILEDYLAEHSVVGEPETAA